MNIRDRRRLYQLFAEILDYPTESLLESAGECVRRLEQGCPETASEMAAFLDFAKTVGQSRMEEVYTRAFDITPTTTLYVGYHHFGETYKRGAFLVKLQEVYREHGFAFGPELADHLCVLLRFASVADDSEFIDPLLEEGISPALEKVDKAFEGSENGYALAVRALRQFLQRVDGGGSRVENQETSHSFTLHPQPYGHWRAKQ